MVLAVNGARYPVALLPTTHLKLMHQLCSFKGCDCSRSQIHSLLLSQSRRLLALTFGSASIRKSDWKLGRSRCNSFSFCRSKIRSLLQIDARASNLGMSSGSSDSAAPSMGSDPLLDPAECASWLPSAFAGVSRLLVETTYLRRVVLPPSPIRLQ